MNNALLSRLQAWYQRQCDGDWEHQFGIMIESCDNPGWWVKIDLKNTPLADVPFPELRESVDASGFQQSDRWLCCRIIDQVWEGAGDETRLQDILGHFLSWAESH